jgi:hypothetical protein
MLFFYQPGVYTKKSPLLNLMEIRPVGGAVVHAD